MMPLDRRLNAFRQDLADQRLSGRVEAARFTAGRAAVIASPVADLRSRPDAGAGLDTQLLCGDRVRVFDEGDGWAWIQAERDSYVGYVQATSLGDPASAQPSHRVAVPRSFVYAQADLKSPAIAAHSLGASLAVVDTAETRGTRYAMLAGGGAMIEAHLHPLAAAVDDFVAVAETLERTPYLWGGASAFGIDCSGLVQLSLRMAGRDVPRDTDMQAEALGKALDAPLSGHGLHRGDLVFWKGHVAIMLDAETIIHANGHTMMVSRERLHDAITRIAYLYGQPTGFRRP